ELENLAYNLSWTWDERMRAAFRALAPDEWEECGHNPVLLLSRLGPDRVQRALEAPDVREAVSAAGRALSDRLDRTPMLAAPDGSGTVAYFSLEFGLTEVLPIYSGGLGVLAGDHCKAASDLALPLVGVGLLYRHGFGRQEIDRDGQQRESYPASDFEQLPVRRAYDAEGQPIEVEAPIGTRSVRLAVWRAEVGRTPLILLDSDLEANPADLRGLTGRLYVPEPERRLPQEIALGIGGMRALRALGLPATVLHMNEGHGFLVAVERIRELRQEARLELDEATLLARAALVFTTHTPVAAGSDYFAPELIQELLGPYLEEAGLTVERLLDLGRREPGNEREPLCTTYVGLRLAGRSVGVSKLHGEVSRRLWRDAWPDRAEADVPIGSVTNGVHTPTWLAPELAALLRTHVAEEWWNLDAADPRWYRVRNIPANELWDAHCRLRRRLVEAAQDQGAGRELSPDALTIGFSRRFAAYKRANLVLGDVDRLRRLLADPERPVQILFAGKAHPADLPAKEILHEVVRAGRQERRIGFLVDYDMGVAHSLVRGTDVWLNNPRRFLEASGTSGMKAAINGGLNLSVLDGWWDEGFTPQIGWAIRSDATIDDPRTDDGAEAADLFRLLEEEVVPLFYDRDEEGIPQGWVAMMRESIRHVASSFAARQMVLRYHLECYAPAARRVEDLQQLSRWGA
ncbi:MAG: alpha-glucan family phosphorylase, partial [Candidatus Dormibacteraeota bacterium]|nr:alpha-glucan family phosphorylase [Candidatus Dormibacteraeota bacterium]